MIPGLAQSAGRVDAYQANQIDSHAEESSRNLSRVSLSLFMVLIIVLSQGIFR